MISCVAKSQLLHPFALYSTHHIPPNVVVRSEMVHCNQLSAHCFNGWSSGIVALRRSSSHCYAPHCTRVTCVPHWNLIITLLDTPPNHNCELRTRTRRQHRPCYLLYSKLHSSKIHYSRFFYSLSSYLKISTLMTVDRCATADLTVLLNVACRTILHMARLLEYSYEQL